MCPVLTPIAIITKDVIKGIKKAIVGIKNAMSFEFRNGELVEFLKSFMLCDKINKFKIDNKIPDKNIGKPTAWYIT